MVCPQSKPESTVAIARKASTTGNGVTPRFFFSATMSKSEMHHICNSIELLMLSSKLVNPKSTFILLQRNAKKINMSIDCIFRQMLTNTCILKIIQSKSPFQDHDPKFLFPHRYKTVPSINNKNRSKWSSAA